MSYSKGCIPFLKIHASLLLKYNEMTADVEKTSYCVYVKAVKYYIESEKWGSVFWESLTPWQCSTNEF